MALCVGANALVQAYDGELEDMEREDMESAMLDGALQSWRSRAGVEGKEKLDLSARGIDQMPSYVIKMGGLRELSLVGNALHTLPAALSDLTLLQVLHLGGNHLQRIPDLSSMPLAHIGLSYNRVQDLPELAGNLPRDLRVLDLSFNELNTVNAVTESLSPPARCPALRSLSLSGNLFCLSPAYHTAAKDHLLASIPSLKLLDGVFTSAAQARDAQPSQEATDMARVCGPISSCGLHVRMLSFAAQGAIADIAASAMGAAAAKTPPEGEEPAPWWEACRLRLQAEVCGRSYTVRLAPLAGHESAPPVTPTAVLPAGCRAPMGTHF